MFWCLERVEPTSEPVPLTKLNTPSGYPDSWINSVYNKDDKGVCSDGFKIQVHPVARAGRTFNVI